MIQLSFLGGIASIGASGILVDTGLEKIVLDYGTKVREAPPMFPIPVEGKIDALLLTHAHLDHSGGIPLFASKGNGCPIYALNCTKDLTELLLNDSVKIGHEEGIDLPFNKQDVKNTIKSFVSTNYRKPFKVGKTTVTYFDAGHIPGSAMVHLDTGENSLLYTGDLNTVDTRLIERADEDLPEIDYLITESTYAQREHPDRKDQERQLVEIVNETVSGHGIALISGFAISRLQEILLILHKHGIDYPVFMDGMAKKATTIINDYKNLLRESNGLDKALKFVKYVASDNQRKKVIRQPCAILTTSGMLNGGPIVWYLKKLYDDRKGSLIFTGYQTEDTPGKILLETGRYITKETNIEVRMLVKRLDFSAHIGRSELLRFIDKINPKKIFCMHGDHTEEFATELQEKGFDATAPVANNRIFNL